MKKIFVNGYIQMLFWILSIGSTLSMCLIKTMFHFWLMSSSVMEVIANIWYFVSLVVFIFCLFYWIGKIILLFHLPKDDKKKRVGCIAVIGAFLILIVVQLNCDRWIKNAYPQGGIGVCSVVEKADRDFCIKVKDKKSGAIVTLYMTKKEHQLIQKGQEFARIDYICLSKNGQVGWVYNYSLPYLYNM